MDHVFAQTPLAMAHLLDVHRASKSLSRYQPAPPNDIVFRARTGADTADLFDLFNEQGFLDDASTHGRFAAHNEFEDWLEGIAPYGKYEVVGQAGTRIVAFGGLYGLADQMSHCGSLTLGVRKDWQRKRTGSTILHLLLVTAEIMMGLRKVALTVFEHNTTAIRLYQDFGFEIEGLHKRFSKRGDAFVNAYSMALFFDPPEVTRHTA